MSRCRCVCSWTCARSTSMPATRPDALRSCACLNSASAVSSCARTMSTRLAPATVSRYRFTATSTTRSRALRTPYFSACSFNFAARRSLTALTSTIACESATRASMTLNGPTIGLGAGNPNASRLRTCRRPARLPDRSGRRSASARQRAPRAVPAASSCNSSPRYPWSCWARR